MDNLTGRLAVTALNDLEHDKTALVEEINRVIKPALAASADSVYIGVLLAASNQVNAQGGCFASEELAQLAELVIDAPIMIGHKKDELPIGRIFKGEIISRAGTPWLRAFFYWHRAQARAEEIKTGIDAGIYKECSLGFLYAKPECGICRADMRTCRHRVNEVVRLGSRDIKAFYYYKQLERVLEISLVYRGAVAGTSVSTLQAAEAEQTQPKLSTLTGRFQLFADRANFAILAITFAKQTHYLRLVNFSRSGGADGRRLRAEELTATPSLLGRAILDRGEVIGNDADRDEMIFSGALLRGRCQLIRKGGQL